MRPPLGTSAFVKTGAPEDTVGIDFQVDVTQTIGRSRQLRKLCNFAQARPEICNCNRQYDLVGFL